MVHKLRSCSNTPSSVHENAHRWHHSHGGGHDHVHHDHGHEHDHHHHHGHDEHEHEHHQLFVRGAGQHERLNRSDSQRLSRSVRRSQIRTSTSTSTSRLSVTSVRSSSRSNASYVNESFDEPEPFDLLTYTLSGPNDGYESPNMSRHSIHSDDSLSETNVRSVSRSSRHVIRSRDQQASQHAQTTQIIDSPLRPTTRSMIGDNSLSVNHKVRASRTRQSYSTNTSMNSALIRNTNDGLDRSHVMNTSHVIGSDKSHHAHISGTNVVHRKNGRSKSSLLTSLFGLDTDEEESQTFTNVDTNRSVTSQSTVVTSHTRLHFLSVFFYSVFGSLYESFMYYIGRHLYDFIAQFIIVDIWILLWTRRRRWLCLLVFLLLLLLLPLLLLSAEPLSLLVRERGTGYYSILASYRTRPAETSSSASGRGSITGDGAATTGQHVHHSLTEAQIARLTQQQIDAILDARLADVTRRVSQDSLLQTRIESLVERLVLERESNYKQNLDGHIQDLVSRLFAEKWREWEKARPPPTASTATPTPPTIVHQHVGLTEDDVMRITRDVIKQEMTSLQTIKDDITHTIKIQFEGLGDKFVAQQRIIDGLEARYKAVELSLTEDRDKLARLRALFDKYSSTVTHETLQSLIRQTVVEEVTSQFHQHVTNQHFHSNQQTTILTQEQLAEIRALIIQLLPASKADGTDLPDYALESGGGSVISTRCTQTYRHNTATVSLFGIPLYYQYNSPRTVIQPDIQLGNCWPFRGSEGQLVIRLSFTIVPTSFTMEHVSKALSPNGSIDSAPKNFTVWGLQDEEDEDGRLLGNYTYDADGPPLQTFPVQDPQPVPTPIVEVKIHANHGNQNYTCVYRIRVHGVMV